MKSELVIDRVQGSERIASLYIIRGVAILFILGLNIEGRVRPSLYSAMLVLGYGIGLALGGS